MRVVVTGASQGIGAAIAEEFAAGGVTLALSARRARELERVAERCRAKGASVECFPCDLTDDDAVSRFAAGALERIGTPDVLVNNAGRFAPGSVVDTSATLFREQLEVNVTSAFLVTRAFLPALLEAGRGHVFFLASVASLRGYAGGAAYCAAKHAVLGLARVLREETKDLGLRVTSVAPGATLTPSWDGAGIPDERFMPARDIARTIVAVAGLGPGTVVEEILLRPQLGDV